MKEPQKKKTHTKQKKKKPPNGSGKKAEGIKTGGGNRGNTHPEIRSEDSTEGRNMRIPRGVSRSEGEKANPITEKNGEGGPQERLKWEKPRKEKVTGDQGPGRTP